MRGSDWSVSSRARYIAICRGRTYCCERRAERMSATLTPKASPTTAWMSATVAARRPPGQRGVRDHAGECPLEFADVGNHAPRDGIQYVSVRDRHAVRVDVLRE